LPVTSIAPHAFEECIQLTSVALAGSVTNIGEYAFADCTEVTNITIQTASLALGNMRSEIAPIEQLILPAGLRVIGIGAFEHCYRVSSITIPGSITSIRIRRFIAAQD